MILCTVPGRDAQVGEFRYMKSLPGKPTDFLLLFKKTTVNFPRKQGNFSCFRWASMRLPYNPPRSKQGSFVHIYDNEFQNCPVATSNRRS